MSGPAQPPTPPPPPVATAAHEGAPGHAHRPPSQQDQGGGEEEEEEEVLVPLHEPTQDPAAREMEEQQLSKALDQAVATLRVSQSGR